MVEEKMQMRSRPNSLWKQLITQLTQRLMRLVWIFSSLSFFNQERKRRNKVLLTTYLFNKLADS